MRMTIAFIALMCIAGAALAAPPEYDAEKLIERFHLSVADTPVRERSDWQRPRRIIVAYASAERLAWLQEAVPEVELIGVADAQEALDRLQGADALIGLCTPKLLAAGRSVRWIQLYSAGVEKCVNLPQFRERSPLLTNMQRITAPVIAEHVIAMMLALTRNLEQFADLQRIGDWRREAAGGMQVVRGKTMLVVGLGGIGTETARRAHALGMTITATRASKREGPEFVSRVGLPGELKELLKDADVVVNALPLTDETRDLFNADLFRLMKPTAFFINVGRGGTVVTDSLLQALIDGEIAGAALDVTDPEPLPKDHPLWRAPNIIITPHVATYADIEHEARLQVVRENLRRYANGEAMISVVDPERGY